MSKHIEMIGFKTLDDSDDLQISFQWQRSAKRDAWMLIGEDSVEVVPFGMPERRAVVAMQGINRTKVLVIAWTGQWHTDLFAVSTAMAERAMF